MNDEDKETRADLAFPHVSTDASGVPSNLMGAHPEEFFSLLGRIVALSALLENRVLTFYQYLVGRRKDRYTELGVSKLIENSLAAIGALPDRADQGLARGFLIEARAIITKRNDYVHNLWPAQGDGQLFGWRIPQKKNAVAALTTETSLAEMRADLHRLVALLDVSRANRIFALVVDGRHMAKRAAA